MKEAFELKTIREIIHFCQVLFMTLYVWRWKHIAQQDGIKVKTASKISHKYFLLILYEDSNIGQIIRR